MNQRGKVGFTGLLLIVLVIYAGYAAVVYISAGISESQIAKEVKDKIGLLRGGDFTPEKGIVAIIEILDKNDIIFTQEDEEDIEVEVNRREITYRFTYEIEMNFLLFKNRKFVETSDRMASYE
jgi:hypothetical protein